MAIAACVSRRRRAAVQRLLGKVALKSDLPRFIMHVGLCVCVCAEWIADCCEETHWCNGYICSLKLYVNMCVCVMTARLCFNPNEMISFNLLFLKYLRGGLRKKMSIAIVSVCVVAVKEKLLLRV